MTTYHKLQGLMLAASLALASGCAQPVAPTAPVKPGNTTTGTTSRPNANGPRLPTGPANGPKATAADTVLGTNVGGDLGKPGRTLYAIYVVGSTLEDNALQGKEADEKATGQISTKGAGSTDFREMIRGYQALTDDQKKNIDVLIMFGGARKQGWQGTKVVNIAQLIADGEDDYFGNGTDYLASDPNGDMGNPKTFESFLKMVNERKAGSSKVFVSLWNHGGSYGGVGPDMNYNSVLSLAGIKQALDATNFQGDYIGFDACLMASVEVTGFMKDHFSYLLASEEEEPGHGWDYETNFKFIGQHPEVTLPELGKAMVDSFIDSPMHQSTHAKTLSVINLKAASDVLVKLEALGKTLGGAKLASVYKPLVEAAGAVGTRYGSEGKGHDEVSVDLLQFASKIQAGVPEGSAAAAELANAVKASVVYSRDDGERPNSSGLSIFSIANLDAFKGNSYNADNAAPRAWFDFVSSFVDYHKNDTGKPSVGTPSDRPDGSAVVPISDPNGVSEVDAVHGIDVASGNAYGLLQAGPHKVLMMEEDREARSSDNADSYVQPAWDGTALLLEEGGKRLPVPLTSDEGTEGDFHTYSGRVQWQGDDALLFVILDKDRNLSDYWVVPLIINKDGLEVQERAQYDLSQGDTIAFYNTLYDTEADAETSELGPTVTIGGDTPKFTRGRPDGQAVLFTTGQDLNGNRQNTDPRPVN